MSRLDIKTNIHRIPVSKNLYGIFLEDINRAGDGGLYPEMLRNRTFEDSIPPVDCETTENDYAVVTASGWRDEFNHGEGLSRWVQQNEVAYTPIPAWYSQQAVMELDRVDTLNKKRQAALSILFKQGGRIYNTGFCGIPQIKEATYKLIMFAKAESLVKLKVAVMEGDKTHSFADITVSSNEYTRYDVDLIADSDTRNAKLEISCPEGGQIKIGYISLMPADTFMGHGLKTDLAEKLRDINPQFFRFPGGCIVEGISPSTAMRFRNTVGPAWERPGHLLMWHYRTYNGLGFHEYLQFCEDLDMEPLYVINCGMTCQARKEVLMEGKDLDDMIQDTMDAIEYAVGSKDTRWGSLRAKMGHSEPFKLNYIEIGNENFGPAYEERYLKCYNTIKQQYPWIKCIANSHVERCGLETDIVDEHYYNTTEFFAEQTHMFDKYDRNGPEIFLGEVAVVRGYVGKLYGALGEAAFFTGIEKNQDVVTLVSYAPLLENINYHAWYPNLIIFNNTESYGIPSYYVWKMFGNHRGDQIVEVHEETDTIYRPVKGMASLLGKAGLVYKNAVWNETEAIVSHEMMGRVVSDKTGVRTVIDADDEQWKESRNFHRVNKDDLFIVFGDEEIVSGTFDIDIMAEKDREIVIGIFSSRAPKEVYVSDETNPPKEWNVEKVKPFLWKMKNGQSSVIEKEFPEDIVLSEKSGLSLKENEFNHFTYTTDGKKLVLSVNGEIIHELDIPSFQSLHTVVSDTDSKVIIKLVNMAECEDKVAIKLDCNVSEEYQVYVMAGDKNAENSFEKPLCVHDEEFTLKGAAREFVYKAPPFSVNVLVLTKKA